ncbi:MAG: tetratricopeptide repeat protein [Bryobacteraceae bacterium]
MTRRGNSAAAAFARIGAISAIIIALIALGGLWLPQRQRHFSLEALPRLAARQLPNDDEETAAAMRFLSQRLSRDPEDFVAQNMLASYFLKRVRETNNVDYLRLATHAANASLASVPRERNPGALSALGHAEFAGHDFVKARDHAIALTNLEPGQGSGYALLGDALLELGDYDGASRAFQEMQRLGFAAAGAETRLARLVLLRGDPEAARGHLIRALAFALNLPVPPRETAAWCYWQLGEIAFSVGEYETAERRYRDALIAFPGYFNALPSLGRVRAARGDLAGAIQEYERAVTVLPDPAAVAALGDLYMLADRRDDAKARYALVEQIGRLAAINGAASNRGLALFYTDHDLHTDLAFGDALREYTTRRDIYGADALAWAALKAGKLDESREAMRAALRLGTQDAKLFYHAGMIARAAGDKASARDYLRRALKLNPRFDPWQSEIAEKAMARL